MTKKPSKNTSAFNEFIYNYGIIVVAVIIVLIIIAYILIFPPKVQYVIKAEKCENISIAKDCMCLERVKWNGAEFYCKEVNESSCIYYYSTNCEEEIVNEMTERINDCNSFHYNKEDYPKECLDYESCITNCYRKFMNYIPKYKDDKHPHEFIRECESNCVKFTTKIYPKEKITKSWLDKNCECINGTCRQPYEFTRSSASIIITHKDGSKETYKAEPYCLLKPTNIVYGEPVSPKCSEYLCLFDKKYIVEELK